MNLFIRQVILFLKKGTHTKDMRLVVPNKRIWGVKRPGLRNRD